MEDLTFGKRQPAHVEQDSCWQAGWCYLCWSQTTGSFGYSTPLRGTCRALYFV